MERFTKVLITLWVIAAIAWQVTRMLSWPSLPLLTAVTAAVALVAGAFDRRSVGIVLATTYVFPLIELHFQPLPYVPFTVLWLAALLAVILPDTLRTSWHVPHPWRVALIAAALATIVATPLIVWREIDGVMELATRYSMHWTGGAPPPFVVSWVLHIGITAIVGILWFDWLFSLPGKVDFERDIITPLVVGAALTAVVSVYQFFVDIRFANQTAFANLHRTTGALYDANLAGMIAAVWLGGTILWAIRVGEGEWTMTSLAVAANAIALWGSGSRTALLVGIAGGVASLAALTVMRWRLRRSAAVAAAALAVVLIIGALGVGRANPNAQNPAARLWSSLAQHGSVGQLAADLWTRNGYGSVAALMIRRFPIAGVGIGSFPSLVSDYGTELKMWLPPDNAQSWVRQQIAEMGIAGAAGWIAWMALFAVFVVRTWRRGAASAWIVRALIVMFGVISLFGMPGQDAAVVVTFWTIAYWYVSLVGVPASSPVRPAVWVSVGAALVLLVVGTVRASDGPLRLGARAQKSGGPFSYGFAPPMRDQDLAGFHVANGRAATLLDPSERWIAVTVKMPKGPPRQIDVRVMKDGDVMLKARLTNAEPLTAYAPVTDSSRRVLIELSARDRARRRPWTDKDDVPVYVKWEFVPVVPGWFKGYSEHRPSGGS